MENSGFFQGTSITRLLQGAAIGAIVAVGVGFIWGGWVTAGAASKMTREAVAAKTVAIFSPICVERYAAKATAEQRAEFANANHWNRDTLIEKTGFATLPGASGPSDIVADACAATLGKQLEAAKANQPTKG